MCMSKNNWETGDHLLLHCELATELWGFVLKTFGIFWMIPASVVDLLVGWYNWFGKHSSEIWNLVPLCLMWSLWQEQNRRIFEDMEWPSNQLLELFSGFLFDWSRSWGFTAATSLPELMSSQHSLVFTMCTKWWAMQNIINGIQKSQLTTSFWS